MLANGPGATSRFTAAGSVILTPVNDAPGQHELPIETATDPEVTVRVSARAKHLRITVAPGRVPELVVPPGTRQRSIARMVERNRSWILRKTREMDAVAAECRLGMDRPGFAWVEGEPIRVELGTGTGRRAILRDGRLHASGTDPAGSINRWYRREARRALAVAVEVESARLGVEPGRLSVRDQRTRWGSCSAKGDLSFSWRLILAPPEVLRYVVIHELCHLRELNHSKRFWALLADAMPGWEEHAEWLREHSNEVGSYRPRLPG